MEQPITEVKPLSMDDFEEVYEPYRNHMLLKNFSRATVKTYLSNYTRSMDWSIANDIGQPFDQDLVKAYLIHRARKYVYYGCGNSRCPKCQGIKRMQWQEKLAAHAKRLSLYDVPAHLSNP